MKEFAAIVLAAGKGTRMKADLPKVMLPVAGRPILDWVLSMLAETGVPKNCVVIGGELEKFKPMMEKYSDATWCEQQQRRGTGDAVAAAACSFTGAKIPHYSAGRLLQGGLVESRYVVVCTGDIPAIRAKTMADFLGTFSASQARIGVLGMRHPDPTGYGRLIQDRDGLLEKIVEEKDASPEERRVQLCNSGIVVAETKYLFELVDRLENLNSQNEYYLTDCFAMARGDDHAAFVYETDRYQEFAGINDQAQLRQMESWLEGSA